jgi:hypothetical protein
MSYIILYYYNRFGLLNFYFLPCEVFCVKELRHGSGDVICIVRTYIYNIYICVCMCVCVCVNVLYTVVTCSAVSVYARPVSHRHIRARRHRHRHRHCYDNKCFYYSPRFIWRYACPYANRPIKNRTPI